MCLEHSPRYCGNENTDRVLLPGSSMMVQGGWRASSEEVPVGTGLGLDGGI